MKLYRNVISLNKTNEFIKKHNVYVDIPDDRGVYRKWLVTYYEAANQFPKLGILRCNYLFKWIEDDGVYRYKRKVWGVNATQNSYTSCGAKRTTQLAALGNLAVYSFELLENP